MTLAQIVAQLQQLLQEHPGTAGHTVVLAPHGADPFQNLTTIHVDQNTIVLEAH